MVRLPSSNPEAVISGLAVSRRSSKWFGPEPASVSSARVWAGEVLQGWADEVRLSAEILDAVRLVVSELVGNAVRHAHTPVRATLLSDGEHRLRLEVEDASTTPVRRPRTDAFSLNGRGLTLVERLSDQWGTEHRDGGKTVWATWSGAVPPSSDGQA